MERGYKFESKHAPFGEAFAKYLNIQYVITSAHEQIFKLSELHIITTEQVIPSLIALYLVICKKVGDIGL